MNSISYRAILLSLALVFSSFAGCLNNEEDDPTIMVSTYHVGELVSAIVGDTLSVEVIGSSNVPVHDFEPSAADIIRLQNSDIFFYHGLNLEPWVEPTLAALGDEAPDSVMTHTMPSGDATLDYESMLIDDLCELLTVGPFESTTLGMMADDHDDHDDHSDEEDDHDDHDDHSDDEDDHDDHDDHSDDEDDHDDHDDHSDEEIEFDPHSWLSPLAFGAQVDLVTDVLIEKYPEHQSTFNENAEAFKAELGELHMKYDSIKDECDSRIVVANHNAYAYIGNTYDIRFITIHGIDPEGEPSAADIADVIEHIEEEELTVLFVEEFTNADSVAAIVEQTKSDTMPNGINIQTLYTMELPPMDSEDDYLSLMEKNLESLKTGMGC